LTDAQSGEFIDASVPSSGASEHDDYTILIIVHFTRTDLEEQRWNLGTDELARTVH
jgi:hypothetical protein